MTVKLNKENRIIPTYVPRKAMDLPMFFERKPYQGASGRLYPLPFSDSISDEKQMYLMKCTHWRMSILKQIYFRRWEVRF